MKDKAYFPMFVDISEKRIVVVGGGGIATRRVRTLLLFAERITVVAPQVSQTLSELENNGEITVYHRSFVQTDVEKADIVIAATDDEKLNEEIFMICRTRGICVNVADHKEKCDFYFPAIYKKDELVVGITASGRDHKKVHSARLAIARAMEEQKSNGDENEDCDRKQGEYACRCTK